MLAHCPHIYARFVWIIMVGVTGKEKVSRSNFFHFWVMPVSIYVLCQTYFCLQLFQWHRQRLYVPTWFAWSARNHTRHLQGYVNTQLFILQIQALTYLEIKVNSFYIPWSRSRLIIWLLLFHNQTDNTRDAPYAPAAKVPAATASKKFVCTICNKYSQVP